VQRSLWGKHAAQPGNHRTIPQSGSFTDDTQQKIPVPFIDNVLLAHLSMFTTNAIMAAVFCQEDCCLSISAFGPFA
jgi:hypothetical protein